MISTAGQRKYVKIEGSRASTDAKPQTNRAAAPTGFICPFLSATWQRPDGSRGSHASDRSSFDMGGHAQDYRLLRPNDFFRLTF